MKEREVSLPLLKFSTTSYNNDGSHFRLVVVVFIDPSETPVRPPVLWSRISPPIFVDSRNKHVEGVTKTRTESIPFDAFPPELLTRPFFKRKCTSGVSTEVPISSDLAGLVNYFTSPNIRQKCRHPLFLAIRFPQALSLYYNSSSISHANELKFLEELQDALNNVLPTGTKDVLEKKKFVLMMNDAEAVDGHSIKILKVIFTAYAEKGVAVCFEQNQLGSTFKVVDDIKRLKEAYIANFKRLRGLRLHSEVNKELRSIPKKLASPSFDTPTKRVKLESSDLAPNLFDQNVSDLPMSHDLEWKRRRMLLELIDNLKEYKILENSDHVGRRLVDLTLQHLTQRLIEPPLLPPFPINNVVSSVNHFPRLPFPGPQAILSPFKFLGNSLSSYVASQRVFDEARAHESLAERNQDSGIIKEEA
eukprot:TRINITY_DN7356_c0_g1_i1.p1 TRINITY_DN7356_c0_g1~~TRINITY_DN7356_c0_g1_i1.p1  ORF type:complete len:418 (-),score=65.58 TRINITY_DN7356_c0_g1_i1:45-1298(-)